MINSRNSGGNKNNIITRRMFIISAAKIILFTGIIGRLFSLQISQKDKYKTLSKRRSDGRDYSGDCSGA